MIPPLWLYGIGALLFAALGLGVWHYHHEAVYWEKRAGLSAADAKRWEAASGDRDAAIAERDAALAKANAVVEAMRADNAKLSAASKQSEAEARKVRDQADQRIRELMTEVVKRPQDVRELGPIVKARVGGLFE